jgi:hypothetical protein
MAQPPFTIPPLSDALGYYTGYREAKQEMLTGTFDCQRYDNNVRLLIQYLQVTEE